MQALELKIPPPIIAFTCAISMWMLPAAKIFQQHNLVTYLLCFLLFTLGILLATSGLIAFNKKKTTFHPTLTEKTTSLVTTGIYQYTRNPMYLGMLLALLGLGILFNNWLSFTFCALFVAYITKFQILPEERFLTELFPDSYPEYQTQVRRWI
ncbi:methyltransferase family protein [Vibrio nigripulchritudo]|uniref:methyltransferase family protein n=1 Tax=Vibrio nigripulchritudo TaxID=28173 RepID=UPI0024910C74|nr:isoprenylcysteine carboxylmethyltransferase family protein [Vibrio nigripulchritudo]BDU37596.1 membrane protein [Vibrio nigripulchritudo]BDU43316.1 membrane protein [Vibrio nigripulchritudo]